MFELYVDNELLATYNHYSDAWRSVRLFMRCYPESEIRLTMVVKQK